MAWAQKNGAFPVRLISDPGFPWIGEIPDFVPARAAGCYMLEPEVLWENVEAYVEACRKWRR